MELSPPRVMGLGTHHKTGTVWMQRVFRTMGRAFSIPCAQVFRKTAAELIPDEGRIFLFSWSTRFHETILARPDTRILHIIRDPRDVLLSGMRYHQVCGTFGENAIHMKREDLGGKSYQEHIRGLPDDEAKLIFEMGERHARTIGEMLAWDYTRPNVIELRYEDLMQDTQAVAFPLHLRALGLTAPEAEEGGKIFWRKSLFGGLASSQKRDERVKTHVTSGKIGQWRDALPRRIAEIYAERHGDDLVTLGYEPHPTHWLRELRHAA